jgi:3D (Asp-Asp-Asp) domain-containing protein
MDDSPDKQGSSKRFLVVCVVTGFIAVMIPAMFTMGIAGFAAGKIVKLPGIQQLYGAALNIGCVAEVKKPTDVLLDGAAAGTGLLGSIVGGVGDGMKGLFSLTADGVSQVPFIGKSAGNVLNGAGEIASLPFTATEGVIKLGKFGLEKAKDLRDLACKLKEIESTVKRAGLDDTLRAALACGDLEKTYGKQILAFCIKKDQADDSLRDVPLWLLPVYQAAGKEYGVPWELLAAINWNDTEYGAMGNWQDKDPTNRNRIGWIPFTQSEWRKSMADGGWAPPHNSFDPFGKRARKKKFTCPMPVDPRKDKKNAGTVVGSGGASGGRQLPLRKGQKPVPISKIKGGTFEATAYGPPWDGPNGMEGSGITSQGTKLGDNPGPYKKYYLIAVDPNTVPYGSYVYVWPNPFKYRGTFKADDTGGAFLNQGKKLDFYDWRGRKSQNTWGRRDVTVTPAAGPSGSMPTNIPVSLQPDMVFDDCDPVDGVFALARWLRQRGVNGSYWKEALRLAASGGDEEAQSQAKPAGKETKYTLFLKSMAIPLIAADAKEQVDVRWPTSSHDVARSFGPEIDDGNSSGILIATRTGEDVSAVEDGTVLKVQRSGGFYGREVCMRHTRVLVSCLSGLESIQVKEGDKLKVGDDIGKTGKINGKARLFLELRASGKSFDPQDLLPFEYGGGASIGGPIASRMVELAKAEYKKGVSEQPAGSNNGKDIARYRTATRGAMSGAPWCSYFTSYIAKMAGVPVGNSREGFGFAQDNFTWGKTKRMTHDTAQAGDLIVFGGSGHIGIVIAKQGKKLTTIEGNSSDAVSKLVRMEDDSNVMGFVRLAELKGQSGGGNGSDSDMSDGKASGSLPAEGSATPNSAFSAVDGVIAQSLDYRAAPINSTVCPDAGRYAECVAILYLRILRGPHEETESLGQDLGGGCGAGTSVPDTTLKPLTNNKLMQDKGKKGLYQANSSWGRTDAITGARAVFTLFQSCNPRFKKNWQQVSTNDWGSGAIESSKAVGGHLSHQNGADNDTTTAGVSEYVSGAPFSRKKSVELASMFLRAGATYIYFDDERVQEALAKLRKKDKSKHPAAVKKMLALGSWNEQPVTWAYSGGAAANSNHEDHFHVRWYTGAANNTEKGAVRVYLGAGGELGSNGSSTAPVSGAWESTVRYYSGGGYGVDHINENSTRTKDGGYPNDKAIIAAAAAKYGIPFRLLWGTYGSESSWGTNTGGESIPPYFGLTWHYPKNKVPELGPKPSKYLGTSGNFKKDAEESARTWLKNYKLKNNGQAPPKPSAPSASTDDDFPGLLDATLGKGWAGIVPDTMRCLPNLDLYGSLTDYTQCGKKTGKPKKTGKSKKN